MIFVLVFGSVATMIIISGVGAYSMFEHRTSLRQHQREQAFNIAEAGVDYYKWHLAHNPTDYQDGTGGPGPYQHEYQDKDGNILGYFSLGIGAPLSGSTVVTVSSTGWTVARPDVTRTISVRVGFPSLTDYTFLSEASMRFGFGSSINGIIHSNGGIRFDATSDSWVRSAKSTYQYWNGSNYTPKNGIWGGGGPKSFWQFPVPAIDFDSVSVDLANLRDAADSGGVHLTSSGEEGWHFVFSGTTYDLYRVNTRDCYNGQGRWRRRFGQWYWEGSVYCYDIGNQTLVSSANPIPSNGAIFVEDDVWVDGVVDGRVSIGVGAFPVQAPYHKIYINGNISYAVRGGDDVLGLLAQGDITIPYEVPDTMNIDAALLSQYGAIIRPYYDSNVKTELTIFGSQISYQSGGIRWVNGFGNTVSGFDEANYIFDGNLRFNPPPSFPVGNTYELISWEELE